MDLTQITNVNDCISEAERKQRLSVALVNGLIWVGFLLLTVFSFGFFLLLAVVGWLINLLLSEYNVRRLQAVGATVSPSQLPHVHAAAQEICERFGIKVTPRIIVVSSGEANAFAVRFARKKVILLLSSLLEGVIDQPAQLRFLLGHEIAHLTLDHGFRGVFEVYKPAKYKQARELTCDNLGVAAAGDVAEGKAALCKLCVGYRLADRLDEAALVAEANQIYAGLTGWLVRRHLTHPPAGARVDNLNRFVA
jgi:Zn-dependent protease with chaperone function